MKIIFNVHLVKQEVAKMLVSKKLLIVFAYAAIRFNLYNGEFILKKFQMMDIYIGDQMPRVLKTTTERK